MQSSIADRLAIADDGDSRTLEMIAAAIEAAHRAKTQLPTPEEVRRQLHTGVAAEDLPLLGDYLNTWLAERRKISDSTKLSYGSHIRLYFRPLIGDIRIDQLRRSHVISVFESIEERNDMVRTARASDDPDVRKSVRGIRIAGAATLQRIRSTLRAALNAAIPRGFINHNSATLIELASGKPPKPIVWTPERVARWRITGESPGKVMVWTPELTGQFLDHAEGDDLYPLFHLVAMRGLRRGEACGLPWTNLDLAGATATIDTQIIQLGWSTTTSTPKSEASNRLIPLDRGTVDVLRAHRAHQRQWRDQAGPDWTDTDLVFTRRDGKAWHPADVTDRFRVLADTGGLPPVRLHDLRHGAATLALAAGAEMKTVQELLGHASYALTADTYTSTLPEYARTAAENAANLVPRRSA